MNLPLPLRRWFGLQLLLLLALSLMGMAAQADPPSRVLRVAEIQGQVLWFDPEEREWEPLLRNQSLSEGDRLRVESNSRVGLRVGPHALWLDERSQLELMRVDDERLELVLDRGALALRLVSREGARETRVRTPEGRFQFDRAGDYRVDALARSSRGQAFDGRMVFDHRGQDDAPLWLDAPESAEVWWDNGPRAERSRLLRQDEFGAWLVASAGFGREDLDRYASRPAYRYVSPELTGADELDTYGRWESSSEFGPLWLPLRVAVDWAPYRQGRWTWHRHWGWTWVDELPWGYATSHYGRWVYWRNRWCWAPGSVRVARPVFAPALVGWVGSGHVQVGIHIGGRTAPPVAWYPLAPYEVYKPWYRHSPQYVRRINPDPDPVTVRRPNVPGWVGHNRAVPGAVSTFDGPVRQDGPSRTALPRPVPVRDEATLRALAPLPEGPGRDTLPLVRANRPDRGDEAPRTRGGDDHSGAPAVRGDSGVPWRGQAAEPRGQEPRDRGEPGVPRRQERVERAEREAPPPAADPSWRSAPDAGVPRRSERREEPREWPRDLQREERRAPVVERSPEPEAPVRRFEPPVRSQPERREEGMPWRSPQGQPQPQTQPAPPPPRMEPPRRAEPPPRMDIPQRRAEPAPSQSAPAPRARDRDDGVPRKRGEQER